MLQREHSAILLTFIKIRDVIKTFVLSIFERSFYTGFTVHFDGGFLMLFKFFRKYVLISFEEIHLFKCCYIYPNNEERHQKGQYGHVTLVSDHLILRQLIS